MPIYLKIKHGHWYFQHEVTCTPAALDAWLARKPEIGHILCHVSRPGLFRFWTAIEGGCDLDRMLSSIAHSTHASLHVKTWFIHSDAPYAGMQVSCGGNYVVADHVTDKVPEHFDGIRRMCCTHCSVALGLVTQEEYDVARAQHEARAASLGLKSDQTVEPPTEYSKLGMTSADVLLCAVLDIKLCVLLDNPAAPAEAILRVFGEIKDAVLRIIKNAPNTMTGVEKFMVAQSLFPTAKLRLVKVTPDGDLEELDSTAPIPEAPSDDGTQSFGA